MDEYEFVELSTSSSSSSSLSEDVFEWHEDDGFVMINAAEQVDPLAAVLDGDDEDGGDILLHARLFPDENERMLLRQPEQRNGGPYQVVARRFDTNNLYLERRVAVQKNQKAMFNQHRDGSRGNPRPASLMRTCGRHHASNQRKSMVQVKGRK